MDTVRCPNCQKLMNVVFGIVGTEVISEWPSECAFCKSKQKFERVSSGWHADEYGAWKESETDSDEEA